MARGDKDYDKKVRKVNKGQKSCKKIDTVHKMVESLIKNDSDAAAEHLHTYLQLTAREILLGEKADEDEKDDKDSDDKDDKPKKGKKGVNPFAKKDDKDSDDDDDKKDDDKDSDDDDKDDKKEDKKSDKKDDKDEKDED